MVEYSIGGSLARPQWVEQQLIKQQLELAKRLAKLVSEPPVFQQPDIQLFLEFFQLERIRCIYLNTLKEYIRFDIQRRNNRSLFSL
jgi:hypothetical protein